MKKYLREGRAERKYEKKRRKTKGDKNAERALLYHLIPGPSTFKKNVTIQ